MSELCDVQARFRGIHAGRPAFLIGTGPSAGRVDPERLRPFVTMIMNEAVVKFTRPTYFFSCDEMAWERGFISLLLSYGYPVDIIYANNDGCGKRLPKDLPNLYRILRKPNDNKMMADDHRLIWGACSAHPAAHLLYIMGCQPIYLLGCDCQREGGAFSFAHVPPYVDKLPKKTLDAFGGDPLKASKQLGEFKNLGLYLTGWQQVARHNPHVEIIDCSAGALTCFKKADINEVLAKGV